MSFPTFSTRPRPIRGDKFLLNVGIVDGAKRHRVNLIVLFFVAFFEGSLNSRIRDFGPVWHRLIENDLDVVQAKNGDDGDNRRNDYSALVHTGILPLVSPRLHPVLMLSC